MQQVFETWHVGMRDHRFVAVSDAFPLEFVITPKAMSSSLTASARSCEAIKMVNYMPWNATPHRYMVTGLRDPFKRLLSGYGEFWSMNYAVTGWLNKSTLQSCFIAVESNSSIPQVCWNVTLYSTPGFLFGQLRQDIMQSCQYMLMRNTAFSDFYDFPLDLNSPVLMYRVLDAVYDHIREWDGAICGMNANRYISEEHLWPMWMFWRKAPDFVIRAEHADQDWEAILDAVDMRVEERCPFLHENQGNDHWAKQEGFVVDRKKLQESVLLDESLRNLICDFFMPDGLCMGYHEVWRILCRI